MACPPTPVINGAAGGVAEHGGGVDHPLKLPITVRSLGRRAATGVSGCCSRNRRRKALLISVCDALGDNP